MKLYLASLLLAATALCAVTIPAGTELHVRLTTEVSSDKASNTPVSGVIAVPVFAAGMPAIAVHTELTGNTADAMVFQAATDQAAERPATLRVQFTQIFDVTGHSHPLFTVLTAVDNARESVDDTGLITGIAASETIDAEIDKGISKLQQRYQSFAQMLSAVKGAFVKQVDASIDFKPGVDLTLRLTKPLDWEPEGSGEDVAPITPAERLVALVNGEPFRTIAQNPPNPSDITNVMFIGSMQQIQQAFQSAGWFSASALNESAKMETARAIIEDRGYSEAPVSILYLDGRVPDMTFQKQNDTFAKRHHIRIWRRPEVFNGKPVWVAAATHDVSITFSPALHSFTHGIDSHIDLERSKVVSDLLFTGAAHGLALVERPAVPKDASNATGDRLETDGKMAVLEF